MITTDTHAPLWILWNSGNNKELAKFPKITKVIVEPEDDVDDVLAKLYDKLKYEFRNIGMTDLILMVFAKNGGRDTFSVLKRNDNVMVKITEYGNSIDSPWMVTLDHLGPYLMTPP